MAVCPPPAAMNSIPVVSCPSDFGQIQKLLFWRVKDGATANEMTAANAILEATYTGFLAAVDGTKMVASPIVEQPESTPGEERTSRGGNASVGGIPKSLGSDFSNMSFQLLSKRQDQIEALKNLRNEGSNLGVILINANNQLGLLADDVETPTTFTPIPINQFFVGDKGFGGFEDVDYNDMNWGLKPNTTDKFAILDVPFDPLTLENP